LGQRYKLIRDLYLADERPWIIAFSGGKDSSATLQIVWNALLELRPQDRTKRIHVAYVDTGMEHPLQRGQAEAALRLINSEANKQALPIDTHILTPEMRHRYFVCVIGRGYAPPTHFFRWCTKGMRIAPMTTFIRGNLKIAEKVVIVLGLRISESSSRARVLDKYSDGIPFQGRYGSLAGATAFTPIEDFGTADVWQYLMQASGFWQSTNRNMAQLYSAASGGECASHSIGDGLSSTCGGSRFGCWTCTVVRKDRSGSALASVSEEFNPLVQFREWLIQVRNDPQHRWKTRRNKAKGVGPLTLATRREALDKLLAAELACGARLIDEDEIIHIQKLWEQDGDRRQTAIQRFSKHQKIRP
jgi:DNA sulfur modification protein DndC